MYGWRSTGSDQQVSGPSGAVAEQAGLDVATKEALEDWKPFPVERAALFCAEAARLDVWSMVGLPEWEDGHGRITFGSRVPYLPIAEWIRFQAWSTPCGVRRA